MAQDDFLVDLDPAAWRITNDAVMGGVSSASLTTQDGALRFAGEVRLDFNGGFASIRRDLTAVPPVAAAVVLRARGDGNRYRLTLYARDPASGRALPFTYYAAFPTEAGRATEVVLPLAAFAANFRGRAVPDAPALAAAHLIGIGIMITRAEHRAGAGAFALDVLRLGFATPPHAASKAVARR